MFRFWKQGDVRHHYDLKQELGKGTFSVVRLGINKKTGQKSAIKIINKKSTNVETKQMLETEISILQRVNHPNVIGMQAMYETKTHLFLVMEYVEGGELFDRIVERGCFSEKDAANIIRQILEAVKYLHSLDIVHRDLKPENVLCATKEALDVKIADFGLSKIIDTENPQVLQTCCGTPSYAAPELLLCEGYNAPVDLWAVGVILYTLLSGCLPFFGETHSELFERILAGAYAFPDPEWTNVSSAAKSLVTALLTADPKKRLTADQALQHPWILSATGTALTGHSNRMEQFVKNEKNEKAKTSSNSLRDRYSQVVTQNVLGPQIYEDAAYGEEAGRVSNRPPLVWDDARDWPLMSKGAKIVSFKKDDFILKEGGTNRNFYRIKVGSVRVEKSRAEGKAVTLLKMTEGLMFGEISMLQASGIISASIRANDEPTELYELNANQLKKTLDEEQHELAERFYRELALKQAQRLSQARQRIEEVLEKEGVNAIKNRQASRTRTASFAMTKTSNIQLSKMFGLRGEEVCLLALPCRWKKTLLHAGNIYVSNNYICGSYNFFALKSKTVIPFDTVTSLDVSDKDLEIKIGCKKQKQAKHIFQLQSKEDFKTTFELLESLWANFGQKSSSVNLMASSSQMLTIGQSIEVDQSLSDALTADDWKLILDKSKQFIYNKNDVVIKQGDQSPQNLYQLAHGRCRVEQIRPEDDSVHVVGVINSGETFGEISFLQNSQITASVVADDDRVEIYVIEGDHLNEIFNEYPAVPGRFYKYLATLISNRLHNREMEILS